MEKSAAPEERQHNVPPPDYTPQPGYPGYYGQPQQGYGPPPQQGYGPPPPQQGYGPPYVPGATPAQFGQQQIQTTNNIVVTQQPGSYPVVSCPAPADHMGAAIFVTLCCFWPTGIVAIMKASEARSALAAGNIQAAAAHARLARSMVIASVVLGILTLVIVAIIIGVRVSLAVNSVRETNSYSYYSG